MTYLDLLVCSLATWHAVEVWHHGSIFASARARLELTDGWFSWFANLMLCPFCLTVHAAVWITVWYVATDELPNTVYWRLPVFGLAIARCANLANDISHKWCRTPRAIFELGDEPPDQQDS